MKTIELTKGKVALVDDEDFEWLTNYKWCASHESRGTKFYAIRWQTINGKQTKIRMHREIMGGNAFLGDLVVDHLNHNSLDNRKCNLEIVTQAVNMARVQNWKRKLEEPSL